MSFLIDDKNLLNTLLKLAQQNQAPAVPAVDPTQLKNIALKFVNNLAEHASDSGQEFTAEKAGSKLNPKTLENLPAFLNFLRQDGIAIGNKKLVLPHAPKSGGAMQGGADGDAAYAMMDKATQSLYLKYPEPDEGSDNFQYYIYKEGMIKYLQDLQNQASENSPQGRILRMYVKNLLTQINNELDIQVQPAPAPSTVTTNQPSEQQTGVQNSNYANVSFVNSQGTLTPQGIVAMVNIGLPLIRGQIVFSRIRSFAEAYMKQPKFPQSGFSQKVIQSLDEIDKYNIPMIQLKQYTYQQIDKLIRRNTNGTRSAADILNLVEVMLTNVHLMLGQIQELFRDAGTGNPSDANHNGVEEYKAALNEQINNIYMENSAGIDALQSQQQQVLRDITNNVRKNQTW